MIQFVSKAIMLILAILLVACGGSAADPAAEEGRVLLWHPWSGADEETLNELLDNFNKVYPGIAVISISHPPDSLKESFIDAATRGLGPDIIIGSQMWVPELAEAKLIRAVNEEEINQESYLIPALNTLRYQNQLYGLPLALETSALYYNKTMVNRPPETLKQLLEQATEGSKAAINSSFESSFWGIQAFGGHLLDQEGRVVLNQGGFANWLDWLIEAGNAPNVILSTDEAVLSDLFTSGEVAFYVGQSSQLRSLQEEMGQEAIGVAPLPAGPNDAAGPFLKTEPIFFSMDSSPAQTERAKRLIEFLGNVEQQRRLAQQTGRVPVNPQARINRRISPAVAGFVEQSKTAEPFLLQPQIFELIAQGDDILLQALEGLITSAEAASALTSRVNEAYGLETEPVASSEACHAAGELVIWHAWPEAEAAALQEIGRRYAQSCPQVSLTWTFIEEAELFRRYRQAVQEDEGPDLLLISSAFTNRLASAGLATSIHDQIYPDFLQRYIPNVPEAMRFEGQLIGLPLVVDTMALYFNKTMVEDPPVDLGDLLARTGPEHRLALPYTPFQAAHWGLAAFGGRLFNGEGGLEINSDGFAEWLNWLQSVRDEPGLLLAKNQEQAQALFSQGEAAYFVGKRKQLGPLQEALGAQNVGVAALPAGPEGSSGPLLEVQGLVINPTSSKTAAAVEFAKFAASAESQAILMAQGNLAPAHVNVADPASFPLLSGFLDQAKTAVVLPNRAETDTILGLGDIIYERVLEDGADPAAVLQGFNSFVQQAHSQEAAPFCEKQGQLTLWHSVEGQEAAVLGQIVADFGQRCPDVKVETLFVPAAELPERLALASGAGKAPDLFLAAHDLIEPLSAEQLIQPVTPWVSEAALIPYLSEATDAMRYAGQLYGLPHSVDTSILFYNNALVSEPASQLFDLFASTTISAPLALDISFEGAFWGAVLFGGQPFALGQEEAHNTLDISRTSLVDWLRWLQSNKDHVAIVMNSDANKLVEMFAAGNAAYLISGSEALPQLRAQFETAGAGPAQVGVAPLPAGPAGAVSPFLKVNGYLFSAAAGQEQVQLALEFATFATSAAAESRLISSASRAPANVLTLTQVDDAAISAIVEQARAGIPLPPRSENLLLQEGGQNLYQSVIEEGQPPGEAMAEFTQYLREAPQPPVLAYAGEELLVCEGEGRLSLWHSLPASEEASTSQETQDSDPQPSALESIIVEFNELCPQVTVDLEIVPAQDLQTRLATAAARGTAPDLFLADHDLALPLIQRKLIRPLTVDPAFLDAYHDKSVQALRHDGALYGLPLSLDIAALYYNASRVTSPAGTLDELLEAASPDLRVGIDTRFNHAYWGVGAFGGSLFDPQGQILSDQSAFESWLNWLDRAQDHAGIVLDDDGQALQDRFLRGDLAYLVADSAALPNLREHLGDQVRVLPLPSGPYGEPSPLLSVKAFFFSAASSGEEPDLALKFAQFAASQTNQMRLAQEAHWVPAHRLAADALQDPVIYLFARQAEQTAVLLPPDLSAEALAAGQNAYSRVLELGWQPQEAAASVAGFAAGN